MRLCFLSLIASLAAAELWVARIQYLKSNTVGRGYYSEHPSCKPITGA